MVLKWFEEEITGKQLEYIRILSSYEDTWVEDIEDIMSFLIKCGKKNLRDLTKEEASKLIQKLLQRPAIYTFPCGEKKKLSKQEVNGISVLGGYLKACLSLCPKGVDVHDCKDFMEAHLSEEAEMYPLEPIGKKDLISVLDSYEKCQVCGRIPINDRIHEFIKLEYPHEVNRFFVGTLYEHHKSYEKNETVLVCPSCHVKIHRNSEHPLYPVDKPKLPQ